MKITEKEVRYVAGLANLQLEESEISRLQADLESILEHFDKLNEIDTSAVAPMAQVLFEPLAGASGFQESGTRSFPDSGEPLAGQHCASGAEAGFQESGVRSFRDAGENATLREDTVAAPLGNEAALANAAQKGSGYFKVPKVIER